MQSGDAAGARADHDHIIVYAECSTWNNEIQWCRPTPAVNAGDRRGNRAQGKRTKNFLQCFDLADRILPQKFIKNEIYDEF